jgi:membrane protease YdiL (CAAX protease family)
MKILPRNPWAALPLVWIAVLAVGAVVRTSLRALAPPGPAWRAMAIQQTVVLVLTLLAAALEGFSARQLGFTRPARDVWGSSLGGGLVLGALATLTILISGARGLRPQLGDWSFAAIVVWIWMFSSVTEEILCRGWFHASTDIRGADVLSLLSSAMLFGGLHLALLLSGVDRFSVLVVFTATTLLGLLAAWARVASGSLYPAFAAHLAFNVGGALAGIGYAVLCRIATGQPPG